MAKDEWLCRDAFTSHQEVYEGRSQTSLLTSLVRLAVATGAVGERLAVVALPLRRHFGEAFLGGL